MIPGTIPIDAGEASELRDLGGGEAEVGSKDLGSSAFGANSTPRSPGRWNSCTGWCCPLQDTVGPAVRREASVPLCSHRPPWLLSSSAPSPRLSLPLPFLTHGRREGRELK